jgi:hypothetical protein
MDEYCSFGSILMTVEEKSLNDHQDKKNILTLLRDMSDAERTKGNMSEGA